MTGVRRMRGEWLDLIALDTSRASQLARSCSLSLLRLPARAQQSEGLTSKEDLRTQTHRRRGVHDQVLIIGSRVWDFHESTSEYPLRRTPLGIPALERIISGAMLELARTAPTPRFCSAMPGLRLAQDRLGHTWSLKGRATIILNNSCSFPSVKEMRVGKLLRIKKGLDGKGR